MNKCEHIKNKSECFKKAQCAVLEYPLISAEDKLEVLRVLMTEEDIAKLTEKYEAEKREEVKDNG